MRRVQITPDTKLVTVAGRPTRTIGILIAIQLGLFLIYAFADAPPWVKDQLIASNAKTLGQFKIWQLASALFLHIQSRPIIVNLLILWLVGNSLERWWGKNRFLFFYFVCGLSGLVVGLLFGFGWPKQLLFGTGGSMAGLLFAFGLVFAERQPFAYNRLVPMKAKIIAPVLGSFFILGNLVGGAYWELELYGGGLLAATFFVARPRELLGKWRVKRAKKKFNVVEGGKKKDSYLN
jgi:membrane associated rhomboid family serine protease